LSDTTAETTCALHSDDEDNETIATSSVSSFPTESCPSSPRSTRTTKQSQQQQQQLPSSSSSTSSSEQQHHKRRSSSSVTFANTDEVVEFFCEVTAQDKEMLWYSPKELTHIKRRCRYEQEHGAARRRGSLSDDYGFDFEDDDLNHSRSSSPPPPPPPPPSSPPSSPRMVVEHSSNNNSSSCSKISPKQARNANQILEYDCVMDEERLADLCEILSCETDEYRVLMTQSNSETGSSSSSSSGYEL
jgi:hypothetical protein